MASSLVRRSLPRVNWHVKTLFVTWLSQVRLCVSAFELLPVIHSQLDAFAHGRELQGQTDACVHLCWWLHLNLVLLFYMSLIPWLADWWVDSTLDSRFSQWFWCTAKTTKMSLHQDDTVNKLFFLLKHVIPSCQQSWLPHMDPPSSSYRHRLQRPVSQSEQRHHPLQCKVDYKYRAFSGGVHCIKLQ